MVLLFMTSPITELYQFSAFFEVDEDIILLTGGCYGATCRSSEAGCHQHKERPGHYTQLCRQRTPKPKNHLVEKGT